ncbi:MAG: NAD(P)-binding protein [Candidatus Sulfotelmatobacter sp.]
MAARPSLSELNAGRVRLPRRIYLPAHSYNFSNDEPGNDALVSYVRRRLVAKVPLAVVGEAEVDVPGFNPKGHPPGRYAGPRALGLYGKLRKILEETGGRILEQLYHPGAQVWFEEQRPAFAPSAYPQPRSYILPIELDRNGIWAIREAFVTAALCVDGAGLSGVEIKADQGKLLHQFVSREYNRRNDEFGGSLTNRVRLLREILAQIRERSSSDFIIGVRLAGMVTPPMSEGRVYYEPMDITLDETLEVCETLEKDGAIDFISVSGETNSTVFGYRRSHGDEYISEATFKGITKDIKRRITLPVLLAGRVLDLNTADDLITQGYCDAVGMARALIADAELIDHGSQISGDGVKDTVRPCISCNLTCVGRTWYGASIACIYDPLSGRESHFAYRRAEASRHCVVIGAGPAGLEFARNAAEFGATVAIYESTDRVGGRLVDWCRLPGRARVKLAIEYWSRIVENHQKIDLHLGCEVSDLNLVCADGDVVVVGNGALEKVPVFVKTNRLPKNLTPSEVFVRRDWSGERVIVVDGNRFGDPLGVGLWIAERGGVIQVVTAFDQVGLGLDPVSRAARLDELARFEVVFRTWVDLRVGDDGAVLLYDHCRNRLSRVDDVETIVWCLNPIPDRRAFSSDAKLKIHLIGDVSWPRGLEVATKEAHDLAYRLFVERDDFKQNDES